MFFKRMEIYGFKSFAQKTTIEFTPGATIIVGPNGCGKSNVLDSVRWVLGEQRARALRGQRMGDVIFNGSSSVKAMNIARVGITIDNEEGLLDVDAPEIQIGRQLLRTGESQYQINRMACRMKSIQELLMDTGVGVNAYSVLEQGRVDQVVTSKPIERRVIFEEAAGISRYRQRRVETLRKLDRTETDLARLADIIREVKGQSISLKRQANRAIRFKALDAELSQLEMALLAVMYAREATRRDEEQRKYDAVNKYLTEITGKIDELEGALDERRALIDALENEARALQRQLTSEREAIAECERAVALFEERTASYERQRGELGDEVEASREQADRVEAQAREVEERRAVLEADVKRIETERNERMEAQQALRRDQERERHELRECQKQLEQLRESQRRRENEARLAAASCEAIEKQIQKARELLAASSQQRDEIAARLEESVTESERLEALIAERRKRLDDQVRVRAEAEETLGTLLDELESTVQSHSEASSRLDMLLELEERYEGYGRGVKEVMQAVEAGRLTGVRGVLSRLIRSQSDYETAIEMALGSGVEDIITDCAADAAQAVEFLRTGELGRACFLPLDLIRAPHEDARFREIVERAGVIGVAERLVGREDWLDAAVQLALGSTILVEDLDVALGLQIEGLRARYVSLRGEVVSIDGSIAGGHSLPAGLLGREREIDELKERVATLKEREDGLRESVYSHRETLRIGGENLNQLREEVHEHDVAFARSRNEQEQLAQALGDLARRLDEQEETARELDQQLSKTRAHIERTESEAAEIGEQAREALTDVEARQSHVESYDEKLAEASERLSESNVALTATRERLSAARDRASALTAEFERARRAAEQKAAQIETLGRQIESANSEGKVISEKLGVLQGKRDATEAKLTERSELRETQSRELDDLRQQDQTLSRDRNALQNKAHQADLNLQQANLRLESHAEHAREKFAKSPEEVVEEVKVLRERVAARAERLRLKEEAEEQAKQAGEKPKPDTTEEEEEDDELLFDLPTDSNQLRERVLPLRKEITRLGPVNTVAIEEYDALRERYTFLQTQEKDMAEARESLLKTVKTIDKTSRAKFAEAFAAIDANFQDVFRRLFNGGKAYLKLDEEAEDILEAGVDIIAQPPGKQLGNLRMMSGGEKALTAIALLFAIFQYRPSPFCVLDEIDAPLDDANVHRLVDMLREFCKTVQFIIITHNKITMQLADTIYGVTMEEPGVSRVLSIPRELLKDPDDIARHAKEMDAANEKDGKPVAAEPEPVGVE